VFDDLSIAFANLLLMAISIENFEVEAAKVLNFKLGILNLKLIL
jgi:hypothetical protein